MGRGYAHIQRTLSGLQVRRTLISAERSSRQQKASSVDGGFSKESTLEADGAPPEIPRLSEDSEDKRLMQTEVPLKPERKII